MWSQCVCDMNSCIWLSYSGFVFNGFSFVLFVKSWLSLLIPLPASSIINGVSFACISMHVVSLGYPLTKAGDNVCR